MQLKALLDPMTHISTIRALVASSSRTHAAPILIKEVSSILPLRRSIRPKILRTRGAISWFILHVFDRSIPSFQAIGDLKLLRTAITGLAVNFVAAFVEVRRCCFSS